MKQPYYIKSAIFDSESGISTVTISTKLGDFTATSKIWKEDLDKPSAFSGCRYAEYKACIKYMKKKVREIKTEKKAISKYYSLISNMKYFNCKTQEARKARRMIHEYDNEISIYNNKIKSLESQLLKMIELHDVTIKKISNKHAGQAKG